MSSSGLLAPSNLVPLMRYRDVGVASEWLCATFGFEPHFAAKAPDGAVFYAELRAGASMIMLGAVGEPSLDAVMQAPDDASGAQTQSCYVVVEDASAHYEQATRVGAAVVHDLKSDDLGGSGYSCRDLDGHVWNFGTYDPWKAQSNAPRARRKRAGSGVMAGLTALTLAVSVLSGWFAYGHIRGEGHAVSLQRLREALLGAGGSPEKGGLATGTITPREQVELREARAAESRAQRAMSQLKSELDRERRDKADALAAAATAKAAGDVAQARLEQTAKNDVERSGAARRAEGTTAQLRAEVARLQVAVDKAVGELDDARRELEAEKTAKASAVAALAKETSARVEEQAKKDDALRALAEAGTRLASLEQDLREAKTSAAGDSLKRMRAVSARRAKAAKPAAKVAKPAVKTKTQEWPFSQW